MWKISIEIVPNLQFMECPKSNQVDYGMSFQNIWGLQSINFLTQYWCPWGSSNILVVHFDSESVPTVQKTSRFRLQFQFRNRTILVKKWRTAFCVIWWVSTALYSVVWGVCGGYYQYTIWICHTLEGDLEQILSYIRPNKIDKKGSNLRPYQRMGSEMAHPYTKMLFLYFGWLHRLHIVFYSWCQTRWSLWQMIVIATYIVVVCGIHKYIEAVFLLGVYEEVPTTAEIILTWSALNGHWFLTS